MLDKQQARPASFPKERYQQDTNRQGRIRHEEGTNHATEEDGDERREKSCKPFRGI